MSILENDVPLVAKEVIEAAFKEHSKIQREEGGGVPYLAHEFEDCKVCFALGAYFEAIA